MNPFTNINMSVIQSQKHRDTATLAAMQSFVLLKNDGVLPIKKLYKTVAVSHNFFQTFAFYFSLVYLKVF